MRFTKVNRFVLVCIATFGTVVIIFIVNTMDIDHMPITEKNVRSQLEQMYDAEVAEVKKNEGIYEAIIAKSGEVYLVEMNAATGDVNSLEHTDEFIIKEVPIIPTETTSDAVDDGSKVSQKTTKKRFEVEIAESNVASNGTTKLVVIQKTKESSEEKIMENPKVTENNPKQASSKKEVKIEEKPLKVVLSSETNKPVETSKEETTKTEVAKTDTNKADESKTDSAKTETAKSATSKNETTVKMENPKMAEQQILENSENTIAKTNEKKPEVTEKPVTVLITVDNALKIAQQQQKGTVESNAFVKTDEGGYYLIVMTDIKTEETKESTKEKKTKATIQVHAISGKILSVTWE